MTKIVEATATQEDINECFTKFISSPFALALRRALEVPNFGTADGVPGRIDFIERGIGTSVIEARLLDKVELHGLFSEFEFAYTCIAEEHPQRIEDFVKIADVYKQIKDTKPFKFKAEIRRFRQSHQPFERIPLGG